MFSPEPSYGQKKYERILRGVGSYLEKTDYKLDIGAFLPHFDGNENNMLEASTMPEFKGWSVSLRDGSASGTTPLSPGVHPTTDSLGSESGLCPSKNVYPIDDTGTVL